MLREGLARKLDKCGTAPVGQRLPQLGGSFFRVRAPRVEHEPLEPREVELIWLNVHDVAGRLALEHFSSQQTAQSVHLVLQ